ncbi:hypothetical protein HW555_003345 [Spodoptera exigua]|uniref:Uncharacterized protein n=1 Tax=Spodoptera exigua TaxID=7107 RepID=A0A835GNJ9_SPOEX|nr:hypothetical protein HW555_003345 [Spodoptera exigua]
MGKMASNNFRARKLVHMVVNTDVCHDNSVRNTELSTSTLTIEIEPEDTKKSEDEIFTDRQDIASSQDVVNADFSLNLSSAALGDIRVSDYSFSKDESFGLLCNETLTHSLMGSPVADFGTEDEPTTSQGLQEIENQRSNESCPDVDNAPTTSNNQILVTDSVMQNEDNEAANRLVCDALKGTTKKGTPRIRKLYTESTNTRKEAKKQKKIEKFCVKPACTTSCKKNVERNFQSQTTEHDGELREIGFLKMKHIKSHSIPDPIQNSSPRGITEARKSAIISTLTRTTRDNKKSFNRVFLETAKLQVLHLRLRRQY